MAWHFVHLLWQGIFHKLGAITEKGVAKTDNPPEKREMLADNTVPV